MDASGVHIHLNSMQNSFLKIDGQHMFISDHINAHFAQYALGACAISVLGYCIFHAIRRRAERNNQAQREIPNFLSGQPDSCDDSSNLAKFDGCEVIPFGLRHGKRSRH